jgi:hypothetical protein
LSHSPSLSAALVSVASAEASSALLARPSSPALSMTSLEFTIFLKTRLRIPIQLNPLLHCSCKGYPSIDKHGDHLCICKKGQEVNNIHNSMVHVIAAFCRSSGLYVRIETPNLLRCVDPHNNTRPDIEIRGLTEQTIIADVGVTFPIPPSLSLNQSLVSGRSAKIYATQKIVKYDKPVDLLGDKFIPFIFESRGLWDPHFKAFFNSVITHGSLVNHIEKVYLKNYWRRRLSMTLQRCLARCIIRRTMRLQSPSFVDEANWVGNIREQYDGGYNEYDSEEDIIISSNISSSSGDGGVVVASGDII